VQIPRELHRQETDLRKIREAFMKDRLVLKDQRKKARRKAQKKNAKASQATPPQGPQPLKPRLLSQSQPSITMVSNITLII
jgi:hypothetical protein